ncbi:esterase YqiA [Shewanella sp. OPT22]|nr:esterase YqiA [Shewanella sp. OPT22]
MLLYIHGFNSSPLSDKGVLTRTYVEKHFPSLPFYQPQLPNCPAKAIELLCSIVERAVEKGEKLRFLGSSLGGYFASYLAEKYGGKAVLINPAVKPYELMEELLGPQFNPYTEQGFEVTQEHQVWLKDYDTPAICNPDRFYVLLQTGDEVLDYQEAVNKYHCCKMTLEAGGNHSFVGYDEKLPQICHFLELTN